MGQISMRLYLHQMRERYHQASKEKKSALLNEFCINSNYHRKSAIRLLNRKPKPGGQKKRGKKKEYKANELSEPLKRIWLKSDQMCGKRLKSALPIWLPFYEKHYGDLPQAAKQKLLKMSSATIDRLLAPYRTQNKRTLCGTKPGSLLRKQIPIKTDQWDEEKPGFVEADTVAHCGDSLAGNFVWSLTLTDIATTWTENRATWNKGSAGVLEQIQSIEIALPFSLLGFDSDNGSEFLNHHLLRYFTENPMKKRVQFTRSRPYKKNDNAHVEQKNWTHVRQLFGYERFENMNMVALMNDLYSNEVSALNNFFMPCIKLIHKERIGSKIKKTYDKAQTPYERVMSSPYIDEKIKIELTKKFEALDPFELQETIQKKLKRIFIFVKNKKNKPRKAV